MARTLDTAEGAREVASALMKHGRARPAVVVTVAAGHAEPFVPVDDLDAELDGLCDVYVLPTGDASWAFSHVMPEGRQVYGGASRVYSTDLRWVQDQRESRLYFAYSKADGRQVLDRLVGDALTAVHHDRQHTIAPPVGTVQRSGVVKGIVGGRALVVLDSTANPLPAVVHPDLVVPGVAAERLFVTGQRVTGQHDLESNRLDIIHLRDAREAFAGLDVEQVLLGQVTKIGSTYVTVALLPGVEVRMRLADLGSAEGEATLVTVGEVLPVEVAGINDGLPDRLTVLPSNFAELARGIAILAGGPPWLIPEQVAAVEPSSEPGAGDEPDDAFEAPEIDPADPAAPLLSDNVALRRRLRKLERELAGLKGQLSAAKTAARTAKQEARRAEKELDVAHSGRAGVRANLFADPAAQLLHEVYLAWAERTTAQDKLDRPWREPGIGPHFIESLDAVDGIDRSKVVEVVADLVSGHAERLAGRAIHHLRSGAGANDPIVTRADGASCWRVYLQHKSPQARRLHFWRLADGSIELSAVRRHDDNTP